MNVVFTRKKLSFSRFFKTTVLIAAVLFSARTVRAQTVYALSGSDLITFNPATPGTITSTQPLTGITGGQVVEGMDFRPATGQLFALGYTSASGLAQLYIINMKTGAASAVGTGATLATGLTNIGFDFNPTVDRIRVTSGNLNYRMNPLNGGLVQQDGNLSYGNSSVPNGVAAAYTNSYLGTGATTMYIYDYSNNTIAASTNPNAGTLTPGGSSTITPASAVGIDLDIAYNATTAVNTAYLIATVGGGSGLYTVNLATGAATSVGAIGATNVTEMAVYFQPIPVSKLIYGLSGGSLISFNSATPGTVRTIGTITGITSNHTLEGLDFRPATGQLFAMSYLSSTGAAQLYTIDTATGAATTVGAGATIGTGLTNIGFDFNPVPDRIRVTASGGQNYRLNPNDGTLMITDGNLNYPTGDPRAGMAPGVVTVAYSNSFAGTTATTMFAYDFTYNSLASSANPNAGVLNTVNTLSIVPTVANTIDMDISTNISAGSTAASNVAYITVASTLYVLNSVTAVAGSLGAIAATNPVTDIAVYIPPVPPVRTVYAISGANLISFASNTPGTVTTIGTIAGVTNQQTLQGLDFRPANGGLYAFGYNATNGQSQLYAINTTTAAATAVGSAFTIATGITNIGFDFNPTVDRIRLTGNNGLNYRLNPNDGTTTAMDGNLAFVAGDVNAGVAPSVAAVGYTNSVAGATVTSLYYYDYGMDVLATTAAPNAGSMNTIGKSTIQSSTITGIDMDIITNGGFHTAFLSATVAGTTSNFYTINIATGEVRLVGAVGATISEMAISGANTLPISLVSFTGKKVGSSGQLNWTTQTETNNSYFVIERSADGRNFAAVSGRINSQASNGNSTQSLDYTFIDIAPAKGINYYRLLQVDKDGRSTTSKTVQLRFDGGYNISLYPNPATSFININGTVAERSDLQIRLSDLAGKMISTTTLKGQTGNWNTQIPVSRLATGTYYISIVKDNTILYTEAVQKK